MTRWLLYAGVAGPAVLTAGWLAAGLVQEGADVRRGSISDLGATEVDRAWLWNAPLTLGGVLIALFALCLHRALRSSRTPTIGASLIALAGLGLALEGALFHLDCRETVAACANRSSHSWRHFAHELESGLGLLALVVAIVLLAVCFRREPGPRSLWRVSLAAIVGVVALLLVSGGGESAWEGVVQRLLVTVVLGWIAVVSVVLASRMPTVEASSVGVVPSRGSS